jgi:hypothetical protein
VVDAAYDQGSGGGSTVRPRVHSDIYNVSVRRSIAREPRGWRSQGLRARQARQRWRQCTIYSASRFSKIKNSPKRQLSRKSPKVVVDGL